MDCVKKRRINITDVAALAGVSVGTVSNVLNGKVMVGEARRQKVLSVIHELGYSPNMLALGLRRKRAPVVGICVPQTSIPYFAHLMEAFEEVASRNGIEIMQVLSKGDPEVEYQRIESLLRYRVGGMLLVPSRDPEASYELLAAAHLPVVVVERAPEINFPFDSVTFDNRGVMEQTVEALIERGHTNILFVVREAGLIVNQQRIEGIHAAIAARGGHAQFRILECSRDQMTLTALLAGEMQWQPRATAIIVSTSTFAAWILRYLQALNLKCPEDVSLLSFEQPDWDDLVSPPLSVVCRSAKEIARMAWTFLMRRMEDESIGPQRVELRAEIRFRGSVRTLAPA